MTSVATSLEAFDKALEEAELMESQHKVAFRKTFEFLKRQYPPRADEAYWLSAVNDFADTIGSEPENKLLGDLMLCVYEYLGKTQKEAEKRAEMTGYDA